MHDDVIKWKPFPRSILALGNPPVTETRSFDVFLDLRLNKRLSKRWRRRWFETPSRSLWRHCNGKNQNKTNKIRISLRCMSTSHTVTRVKCMTWMARIAVWLRDICSHTAPLIHGLQECVSENTRVHQSFTPDNAHIEASQTLKVNGRFSAAGMSERRRDYHGNK